MNEIKCPNCGEVFTIDESNYESIAKQIRDHEFNEELRRREDEFRKDKENSLNLLKAQNENKVKDLISDKEKEIERLKNELNSYESRIELAKANTKESLTNEIVKKDSEILKLKSELSGKETEKELEVSKAVSIKEQEIAELKASKQASEESFRKQLTDKDDLIAYYKEFKAKQSTKMIGENLEQHCYTEFEKVRPLFRNVYFEKDNDASGGSKGDFIYRETDDDGTEILSIMFEMKNEADETSTKHKNEDFLLKLDKDRVAKKCEYAILVSLLEMDSELYNQGIVDMSHKYEKMYVVRPQNFIPIITILRNAALNSMSYKKQLEVAKAQDVDFTNFENNMNTFKEGFAKNYELASKKFLDAIDDIDKTIKALEKTRADLVSSERNLRLANDKAQDLSVKKLTKNAPSIMEKIKNS